jgi:hypothetical protein
MTKAFLIGGIIGSFLLIALFLGYAGLSYNGMVGYNVISGETPTLPTSITDAFWNGFTFITGALIFQVPNIPVWVNLFMWLFSLALVVMIIEIARGV